MNKLFPKVIDDDDSDKLLLLLLLCTRIVLSRHIMAQPLETYLSYFSHSLMIILIFHGIIIIINLLLLY
jgi:hypothetical protein